MIDSATVSAPGAPARGRPRSVSGTVYRLLAVLLLATSVAPTALVAQSSSCWSGEGANAIVACRGLLDANPIQFRVHLRLAELLEEETDLDGALAVYRRALELYPRSSEIEARLAIFESKLEEQEWIASRQQELRAQRDQRADRVEVQKCLTLAGKIAKLALPACEEAVASRPDDPALLVALGDARQGTGDGDAALESWRRALEVDATNVDALARIKAATGEVPTAPAHQPMDDVAVMDEPVDNNRTSVAEITPAGDTAPAPNDGPAVEKITRAQVSGAQATTTDAGGNGGETGPTVASADDLRETRRELEELKKLIQQVALTRPADAEQPASPAPRREPRNALVIGNAAYSSLGTLRNPVNDATDVAKALEPLGFNVELLIDADLREMEDAVRALRNTLSNEGGTGLFYYAGHGVQVDGANYLVPVSADLQSETDVRYKALNVGYVLGHMERANKDVNIIILDACRDNPFVANRSASMSRGLAQMEGPAGSIIAYATAPGDVALDGTGSNGTYTRHLVEQLRTGEEIPIELFFKRVRIGVEEETGGQQIPWESSSLRGHFSFR